MMGIYKDIVEAGCLWVLDGNKCQCGEDSGQLRGMESGIESVITLWALGRGYVTVLREVNYLYMSPFQSASFG